VVVSLENGADHIAINVDDHGAPNVDGHGAPPFSPLACQGTPAPSSAPIPPIHRGLGLTIAEGFCRQHGGRLVLGRSRLGGLQVGLQLGKHTLARQRLVRPRR
jgi:K+-sensing histidine kinase KdpD